VSGPVLIILVTALGTSCGALLAGTLESYTSEGSLRPWPPCQACPLPCGLLLCVPLVGPLLVRRRLAACALHGPLRLLMIQVVQGVVWGALAARYGATALLPVSLVQASLLLAVLFIDAQHRLIPHGLVVPGALLAMATSVLWPNLGLGNSLLGGVGAFVVFTVLVRLAARLFGEGAFGQGDANLAGWIGLLCGYPLVAVSLSVGVFLGGVGALSLVALRRGSLRATIPYGPFLVAGVLYVLLAGNTLHSPYSYV
jgi:leader peptidase (prepilin peptidase)/N-methyltransferase